MTGAKILVTKDSGNDGGFEAKADAALSLRCQVIAVERPVQEDGYTFDELLDIFGAAQKLKVQEAFFPLFVNMNGRKVLLIGGGNVAERRIKILKTFGAEVTVISPEVTEYLKTETMTGAVKHLERKYKTGDITGLKPFLVMAATNERQVNYEVMTEAKRLGIHVSVADNREECSCFFPAIAESGSYIAGVVSKNGDHTGLKQIAEKIRRGLLT